MFNDIGNHVIGATAQVQPCTDPQCYAVPSKMCLFLGDSSTRGYAYTIVGQIYTILYDGKEEQCQSG